MIDFFQRLTAITDPDDLYHLAQSYLPASPFHLYSKDRRGKYLYSNEATAKTIGFASPDELTGCTDYDLCAPATAAVVSSVDTSIIYSEQSQMLIEHVNMLNGGEFSTFSYKLPLRSHKHKVIGIFGLSFVINQEKFLALLSDRSGRVLLKKSCIHDKSDAYENYHLTFRQQECLWYLVKGMTIKQIASELQLSPRTIEHHIESIKNKLHCHSRSELIAKALQQRFIMNRLMDCDDSNMQ